MGSCDHLWRAHGLWDGAPVSGCSSPVQLVCTACGVTVGIKCQTSREDKCPGCAKAYRGRVGRCAGSGMVTGVAGIFLTLTAPGEVVHYLPNGSPCPCTPAERGDDWLGRWNADAAARWNRFLWELSRKIGANVVVTGEDGRQRELQGLVYFRAAEVQRRGALHYHVMLKRRDGRPLRLSKALVRRLAIKHGFGHSVDLQRLEPGHANYVAKYVSKSASSRMDAPWVKTTRQREVVEELPDGSRVLRASRAVTSFTPTFRTWTASRLWGRTMGEIRRDQQHYLSVLAALPSWAEHEPRPVWARVDGIEPAPAPALVT